MDNETVHEESLETLLDSNEQQRIRLEKANALREKGIDPFDGHLPVTHHAADILQNYTEWEGKTVSIAGRMTSQRIMGKASFAHLMDLSGQMQVYLRQDDLGEEAYAFFQSLDLGDILGVEGKVFTTRTGEISIHGEKVLLLSKAMRPLPEKWHGLRDVELRYRNRHLDLIANPGVKDIFIERSRILHEMRSYLNGKGFLEVETPTLHPVAGGAAARPFITYHNALSIDLYMRIALELHLKRLIVGGLERVFEIGRVFRNEGIDTKHNPEFTMMEVYQAYADYHVMMDLTEDMIRSICTTICGSAKIQYQGQDVDLESPWRRVTMVDLVKESTGADYYSWSDDTSARKAAETLGVEVKAEASRARVLYEIFDALVEPLLVQPTFVIGYPLEISPLAKTLNEDPAFTARFELFITGREIANAYSELNDPVEQRQRFVFQAQQLAGGDEEAQEVDEEYIAALEQGMPPTGGLGVGMDRLVMLLTDAASIRDVILFPTMRPLA